MALPNNMLGIDYEHFGYPHVGWTAPSLGTSASLDNEIFGIPVYLQDAQTIIAAAVLYLLARQAKGLTSKREFPNRTEEAVWESQVKQIVPYVPVQYPLT